MNYAIVVTLPNGRQEVVEHLGRQFHDEAKTVATAVEHVRQLKQDSEYRGSKFEIAVTK
jgi:hypothetical protein